MSKRTADFDVALLLLIAFLGFLLFAAARGAYLMSQDREDCETRGGVQMDTGNGRVCVSKDILLKPKG